MTSEDNMIKALAAHKSEIDHLAGENLALQTVLVQICRSLIAHDPALAEPVSRAFDNASDFTEQFAISSGKSANPEHTVKALGIVEDLRKIVFPKKTQPRSGI